MSADNYHVIHNHPSGSGYCVVHCDVSSETKPSPRHDARRFDTVRQAFEYAEAEESEYGTRIAEDVDW